MTYAVQNSTKTTGTLGDKEDELDEEAAREDMWGQMKANESKESSCHNCTVIIITVIYKLRTTSLANSLLALYL